MSLNNEQKAQRLEGMAESKLAADAALLRECAAMMRAMAQIHEGLSRTHQDWDAGIASESDLLYAIGACTEMAAPFVLVQAAAVAWVDGRESGG